MDSIACRARLIGDNAAFSANQCVEKRRLADVRSSYDGNARQTAFRIFGTGFWKCFDDLVEQVAGTGAVFSRDGEYVAQAELIEFSGEGCFIRRVGFVGGDVNRLVGCA